MSIRLNQNSQNLQDLQNVNPKPYIGERTMRNKLFSAFAALAILGCGGDNIDNLPCITCGDDFLYSLPSSSSIAPRPPSSSSFAPSIDGCPNASVGINTVSCGGQTYRTVNIGGQVWMAENLNYNASGSTCYDNDESNCGIYGSLYNWATAVALPGCGSGTSCGSQIYAKHRGICPAGWHIPSDAEWTALTDYVGSSTAGTKLKSTSRWYNCGPSGSGSSYLCEDAFGFSALPGGNGFSYGDFYNAGNYGIWWSATENDASDAYGRDMHYDYASVYRNLLSKTYLFSVRCVQD
jgi:uncharacterized protein (TIGR02145 family)